MEIRVASDFLVPEGMIVHISALILSISWTLERGTAVALDFSSEAPLKPAGLIKASVHHAWFLYRECWSISSSLSKCLHVAAVAVTAIMSIGVWIAIPESTAARTWALLAPRDSAASTHTLVTSAAAEDSTLPISWLDVPAIPFWNGEPSSLLGLLLLLLLIPAMAAASCVSESAACNWAVWSRLSSLLFSFLLLNKLVKDWPLSHIFGCFKSICTSYYHYKCDIVYEDLVKLRSECVRYLYAVLL